MPRKLSKLRKRNWEITAPTKVAKRKRDPKPDAVVEDEDDLKDKDIPCVGEMLRHFRQSRWYKGA